MENQESFSSGALAFQNSLTAVPSVSETQQKKSRLLYSAVKRVADITTSIFALVLLSLLLLSVAVAIKTESNGPVFFSQMRVGKNGKTFRMYKFRSMCANAEERLKDLRHLNEKDGPIFKMANDPRITKIGRFIRRTSIDELPQLLNVIKGDMSIVGPRPPLQREVEQYAPHQLQRLAVKPGLTCYWQISGRSNLSFEEWVKLDLKYIEESSLTTDFKIVLKTFPVVLLGWGAY
jgi:exopolysaccharide biosynthesis polyprenyl glycosylphosphotransferase